MATTPIPGKTTKAKFWTALGFTVLIAVLNFVVQLADASPQYQTWGSLALALLGAISVYAVPNKLIVGT